MIALSHRSGFTFARPDNGLAGRSDAGQRDPGRAVLLLHGRAHVAHPRGLHDVRDGRRAPQERAGHRDEEHPDDRGGHPDHVLHRLVDLQLQPARDPADWTEQLRLHQHHLSERDPVVGHLRAQPDQQHQSGLLPGLHPVLLDDRLDHVRVAARAGSALGLSGPGLPARLGRLDAGRGLGLERGRLDDAALRLPRLDRLGRGARRFGSLHARRAIQSRATNRQVHEGGSRQGPSDPTTST